MDIRVLFSAMAGILAIFFIKSLLVLIGFLFMAIAIVLHILITLGKIKEISKEQYKKQFEPWWSFIFVGGIIVTLFLPDFGLWFLLTYFFIWLILKYKK